MLSASRFVYSVSCSPGPAGKTTAWLWTPCMIRVLQPNTSSCSYIIISRLPSDNQVFFSEALQENRLLSQFAQISPAARMNGQYPRVCGIEAERVAVATVVAALCFHSGTGRQMPQAALPVAQEMVGTRHSFGLRNRWFDV